MDVECILPILSFTGIIERTMFRFFSLNYNRVLLLILLAAALAFAWWTISPLFLNTVVSEPLMENGTAGEPVVYREGRFEGRDGHAATGTVRIINRGNDVVVRFEDGFEVTNGPDLYVHFGNNGSYDPQARLGPLKGNVGSQNYVIPNEIDYGKYDEVWIWCRAFRVPFGVAELQ
jgi:hypothetical protein